MTPKPNPFEPLLERAVDYGTTTFQIIKLRAVDKTAEISSSVVSRFFLLAALLLFVLILSIAAGFWIGDAMGKIYFGFLIVAGFYALVAFLLALLHPLLKAHIYDLLIRQMLK